MRKVMLAISLFVAVPVFGQSVPVDRGAPVSRNFDGQAVDHLKTQDAPPPAPKPTVNPAKVKEAQDQEAFLKLLVTTGQAVQTAVSLGTLASVALAALAVTYLLMFLVKSALKLSLSEEYKKLLRAVLAILTLGSGVLGYVVFGVPGAVAAGLGAAAASPFHDALDGVRSLKKLKT